MTAMDQSEVIAFLSRPDSHGPGSGPVERIDTHGAVVFLVGERAYKLKRAVSYSYLDYGSAEKRRQFCEAELALNRRTAPELYLSVQKVSRGEDGALRLGGAGEAVDWLVVMRRFDQDALLDRMAERGALDRGLVLALADRIVDFHRKAEPTPGFGGHDGMRAVLRGDIENLRRGVPEAFNRAAVDALAAAATAALDRLGGLLDRRRDAGRVRRCHGDLHLRNICLVDGAPTLFDCIEFNDRIACIDVLYDLAFLLMDLDHRGLSEFANAVMNRYVDLAGEREADLAALPLFLALRAEIRAHVGVATAAAQAAPAAAAAQIETARGYLAAALAYLRPAAPCLVAVGGLSGTGKSTLAYGLAPTMGGAPGGRVLRTDMLRKRLAGVTPETRLPAAAYTRDSSRQVYEALYAAAAEALAAGRPVIADAVFADPAERAAIAGVAEAAGVAFTGLWLEAPRALLDQRIAARRGDASDATTEVLRRQLGYDIGPMDWVRIDAGGDAPASLSRALAALRGRSFPATG
jgi:aminoglycoside phosphotransferase family enzyme/predicted kinase